MNHFRKTDLVEVKSKVVLQDGAVPRIFSNSAPDPGSRTICMGCVEVERLRKQKNQMHCGHQHQIQLFQAQISELRSKHSEEKKRLQKSIRNISEQLEKEKMKSEKLLATNSELEEMLKEKTESFNAAETSNVML